jgi:tetratricopeptide (TPR) repeat protein
VFRSSTAVRIAAGLGVAILVLALAGWRYRSTRPAFRLARGQEAARIGDFDKAERYATMLDENGDKDRSLFLRGEIQFLQHQPARALSTLSHVKDVATLRTDVAFLQAQCLLALSKLPGQQWRLREAERALLFVGGERPDHADARRLLAIIYYDQGDYPLAIALLQQVADLDPQDARPLRLMGLMFKDMEQPAEAVTAYKESLRRNPNPPDLADVRIELAECLLGLHKEAEVLDLLKNDNSPAAVCARVECMIIDGQVEAATALLDQSLRKNPDHGGLLRLRADRYRGGTVRDVLSAAKLLERVVDLDEPDSGSQYKLALCYQELAQSFQGFGFVERALLDRAKLHEGKAEAYKALAREMHDVQMEAMKDPWDAKVRERLAELSDKVHRPELAKMWRAAAAASRAAAASQALGP